MVEAVDRIGVPPQKKRTARTTSKQMTVITKFHNWFLKQTQTDYEKPSRAWAWTVREKNRQEALDTEGSFRDGTEAISANREGRKKSLAFSILPHKII